MNGEAVLSEDGRYRYVLRRYWDTLTGVGAPLFVMLNPSTADASTDDATIRRCRGFAEGMGFAGFTVVNLYAFRATSPADLWEADDPVGPENDDHLIRELDEKTGPVICAWGSHARPLRVQQFVTLTIHAASRPFRADRKVINGGAIDLHCLGRTLDGSPRHPLYLRRETPLQPWAP